MWATIMDIVPKPTTYEEYFHMKNLYLQRKASISDFKKKIWAWS